MATSSSSIPQTHSEIEIEIEMENQRSPRATSSGASSSSTAADSNNSSDIPYDVFINHRGEVKKTFASHLYRGLLSRRLRPFLDQQELQEGLPFPSQLQSAIRSASVHIAILSPNYAGSRWCLDELLLMQKSGAPIIPIFYHVTPDEVRWTDQNKKGKYACSLNQLQMKKTYDAQMHQEKSRYDSSTIQNWRDALSSVANISGFDLDGAFNGDEGHMLEKIVERVVKVIKKPGMYVARYPTGLNDKVTDFETTVLKKQQQHTRKVQVAGIVGLGGLGKTTLALELFNRKRSEYNKSYFLSDVRENANKSSLHSLQRVLLKGLGVNESDLHIDNIYEGIGMFEKHLKSSHVLLILDDIDHQDQLEALLPVIDVLRSDSLILITSRYKDVLARSGVEQLCIYKLTGLPRRHSQELFCSYAFCQAYPLQGFEDLLDKFLQVCNGLPLSLKVFGALLYGKNEKSEWEAILHQLKVPTDIQKKLKISYDALSREEQEIFLDIACFFIGQNKNSAITVWNGSGWEGLLWFKSLEDKSLVEVDDKNVIHMHDHLRDLGRDLAEDKLPRRLYRLTGNFDDWQHQQSSVITEARGIRILAEGHRIKMLSWYQRSHQLLGNRIMKLRNRLYNKRYRFHGISVMNLELLETVGHLSDCILRVRSPNLIWLYWRDCPYIYLPSWITLQNLRVLKMEGRELETLWQGKSQAPLQLQELEIIYAKRLSSIPKSIGQLKHLARIVISSSSLAKLPEEFGNLKSLRALVLHAWSIKSLPKSLGKLTNLHHMDLSRCAQLERLPDSFGSLANLHHMDLSRCSKLESLPDSFGSLANLHHMDLSWCAQLESLPDSFGSLANLHQMDLSSCLKLERLPASLDDLINLHHMDLSWCEKLERLPDSLGSLSSLKYLNSSCCPNLTISSDTLGNIKTLEHVDLSGCEKIEVWPWQQAQQRSLKILKLTSTNFKELPSAIGVLSDLDVLWIGSPLLNTLPPSVGDLRNLKELVLKDCRELKCLPASVGRLSQLTKLEVVGCPVMELPFKKVRGQRETVGTLKSDSSIHKYMPGLRYLILREDTEISEVSFEEGVCPNLQEFILVECINVVEVVTLPNTLIEVKLFSCYNLRSIEGLCGLAMLSELYIKECNELEELPGVKTLVSLKELNAIDCVKLMSIRDLAQLTKLVYLNVEGCVELEELEGVENCISLGCLIAKRCPKLRLGRRVVQRLRRNVVETKLCRN